MLCRLVFMFGFLAAEANALMQLYGKAMIPRRG
jgi:hypothetical protein